MTQETTSSQDSSQDWTFKTEEEILEDAAKLAASSTATDFLVFREAEPASLVVNLTPDLTMTFHKEGKPVGSISWSTGKFVFDGEADPSAKAFLTALQFYIDGYFHNKVSEAQVQISEHFEHFK